jgi:hypothetical protein
MARIVPIVQLHCFYPWKSNAESRVESGVFSEEFPDQAGNILFIRKQKKSIETSIPMPLCTSNHQAC